MKKKVKMLVSIAGLADKKNFVTDFSLKPGDVIELSAFTADAWIAAGHCVPEIENKK